MTRAVHSPPDTRHPTPNTPMPDRPLVSVNLATFNRAALLGEAIESLLAQDYERLEIIVADDGSTDNTAQVMAAYRDRVAYLSLPHRGVGAARNKALAASKGSLIALHDSDDTSAPNRISTQVEAMSQCPEAGLCHTAYDEFGHPDCGPATIAAPDERCEGWCFEKMFTGNAICNPSSLIRRDALPPGGYCEDMPRAQDYALALQVLCQHPAVYVPEVLYHYRWHAVTPHERVKRNQLYADIARLRCLDAMKHRIGKEQRQCLFESALSDLQEHTYDRYWHADYELARVGFRALRQYGRAVPWRHRLKARIG